MISVSVSVDVPNLADGVRFYSDAFGFSKVAEPIPGLAVLRAGSSEICILEKAPGSAPSAWTGPAPRAPRSVVPVARSLLAASR